MKKVAALLLVLAAALSLAACGSDSAETAVETGAESAGEAASEAGETAGGAASEAGETATEAGEAATNGGESSGGGAIKISAPEGADLAFEQKDVTAKAGTDTLEFDNPQSLSHDVKIEDSSGKEVGGTELVSGGSATASVDLKPGTYTFFCSVPGHREAGMEGTLTVK
jgi:plastocyanin